MENITTKNNTQNPEFPIVVPSGETATKEEIDAFLKAAGIRVIKVKREFVKERKARKEQEAREAIAISKGESPYPPEVLEAFKPWADFLADREGTH
jgi:hypothetical protein